MHHQKKGEVQWKASPTDVSKPLHFEPEAVVVFNVLYVWPVPSDWFVPLTSLLCHSGTRCTTPGPALENPHMRLLPAQLASARSRGNVQRRGAQASMGQRASVVPVVPGLLFWLDLWRQAAMLHLKRNITRAIASVASRDIKTI